MLGRNTKQNLNPYSAISDFVKDYGLSPEAEAYMGALNKLAGERSDTLGFRREVSRSWNRSGVEITGVHQWITNLALLGATTKNHAVSKVAKDGVVVLLKSRRMSELMNQMRDTYEDIILTTMLVALHERLDTSGEYSLWRMRLLGTKLKLIWELVSHPMDEAKHAKVLSRVVGNTDASGKQPCEKGLPIDAILWLEEVNLIGFLQKSTRRGSLVDANLLPVLKAAARMKSAKHAPRRLLELEAKNNFSLIGQFAPAETDSRARGTSRTRDRISLRNVAERNGERC